MSIRDTLIETVTAEAFESVHQIIWHQNNLTAAEGRLAWLMLIDRLLQTARSDAMTPTLDG